MKYRFLARIIIEATTPIVIKSGEKNILTDGTIMRDVNDLPYIPGTSIAGVVRHAWIDLGKDYKDIFGYQDKDSGEGSRIIFSEARIMDSRGCVIDGLQDVQDCLLNNYKQLPIRQHVRITEKGIAEDQGKYDEEVVYKGTRFCFEMELIGEKEDEDKFNELLAILQNKTFRLGSGTRSGFGEIKVVSLQRRILDLTNELDLESYIIKSSHLEENKNWYSEKEAGKEIENSNWTLYELQLKPVDFFLFGSGYGDEEVDMTPVQEKIIVWDNDFAELKDHYYLIPASSLKGAISHRVAFHYNRLKGIFADLLPLEEGERKKYLGKNNEAVKNLFGSEGDNGKGKLRGNVMFSDLYIDQVSEKILNHVKIDRFTGGAIDGALFSEKVVYANNILKFYLWVNENDIANSKTIKALEITLDDICKGLLPLGGGVNRGNGFFTGKIFKKGEELCVER